MAALVSTGLSEFTRRRGLRSEQPHPMANEQGMRSRGNAAQRMRRLPFARLKVQLHVYRWQPWTRHYLAR